MTTCPVEFKVQVRDFTSAQLGHLTAQQELAQAVRRATAAFRRLAEGICDSCHRAQVSASGGAHCGSCACCS